VSDNQFGNWLRRKLKDQGMSQSDLARAMETSTGTVSMWVTGKRVPDPDSCDRIADVLLLDLDVVLFQAGHRPLTQHLSPDDPALEFHGLIDRIDWNLPGTQKMARAVLRQLVDLSREAKT
jgi:transcriptional regulator with XRE-family HTH domain